jgi:internalin A
MIRTMTDVWSVSQQTRLTSLDLSNSVMDGTFSLLAGLTNLQHLTLHSISNIYGEKIPDMLQSLQPALRCLQTLDVSSNKISYLVPLMASTGLKALNLIDNEIECVQALSGLTALETLRLCTNNKSVACFRDISGLAGLTALETLDLSRTGVRDLMGLTALTRLTSLDITSNNVSSLVPLAGLTALRKLDIHGCTGDTDASALTWVDVCDDNDW